MADEMNAEKTIRSASESLINFSDRIVPILIAEAMEALQMPDFDGLEFAAVVLDDALKYNNIYPRARGTYDDSMYKAAQYIKNRNTE